MRILHLLSQTELTGSEAYAQTLIQEQIKAGHEVHLISDRIHLKFPIPHESLQLSTASFAVRMQNILKLRRFLREKKIEVIHSHSRAACRHAHWARLRLSVIHVATLHGRQHFSLSKWLFDIYGTFVITICENLKKSLGHDFGMRPNKIKVIPNPVSQEKFPLQETLPVTRQLALIARSTGPKGLHLRQTIEACCETWLREIPQLKICVVTPQPQLLGPNCLKIITQLSTHYPERFEVIRHQPDLTAIYMNSTAVVGAGRIAIEALLSGRATFALGEYKYEGFVSKENWKLMAASNFGDIGAKERSVDFDPLSLLDDVLLFLKNPNPWLKARHELAQRTRQHFSVSTVVREIEDIYKAARFRAGHPMWIPTLMYHKIPQQKLHSRHRIFVTKANFEKHLQFFQAKGFTTLWFSDIKKFWEGKLPMTAFPKKPLLLTFDDGYRDNFTHALPLLKKYQMKANIFLLADPSITKNTWDPGEPANELMTPEEKKQLVGSPFEIGSHGLSHRHFTELSSAEVFQELEDSKKKLEQDFIVKIVACAYPFGDSNDEISRLARAAGYLFAVNTDAGGLHLAEDPFSIFRANLFPEDGNFQLWKKTSTWYRKYFYWKRGR